MRILSQPARCRIAATLSIVAACFASISCEPVSSRTRSSEASAKAASNIQLPTGAHLDPAASSVSLGSMPLALAADPRGRAVVALNNGWREQGIQLYDRDSGRVVQTISLPAVFLGLAFSHSGDTLFVSGGFRDVIYELTWDWGRLRLVDSIALAPGERRLGRRYPAGVAVSPDGRMLYVAENLADSLTVIDVRSRRIVQRLPLGRYPYAVLAARDGRVLVSIWGDTVVSLFTAGTDGQLVKSRDLPAGRYPSALLLNRAETRLFITSASTDRVTVLDVPSGQRVAELRDPPPAGPSEGSTPNALALSADEQRLFVAEADNNAVAVFDLSATTSASSNGAGRDSLAGRVPVEWYPTALLALGDTLLVANGKGHGSAPNPDGPTPYHPREEHTRSYTLGQLTGSLMTLRSASLDRSVLAEYSRRVAAANGWANAARPAAAYPPFEHVIYVIKENRTYDEVLGDLSAADGDSSLALFPRANTPNHHALAERFGIFDRFFVNAEVSADGHNWSMAAYANDYLEKTVASHYSERGRTYDYEGLNRGGGARSIPSKDVSEPASGYLWDLAERARITFRNYGEFVSRARGTQAGALRYVGNKPFLAAHSSTEYPGFDLDQTDQHRMDIWLRDFSQDVRTGTMPQLEIVRLPNDHTAALKAGAPTPRAYLADNDLAFGRMIEALSASPYWRNTVVFVLEDDAQNGPDHIDSHRSELFVISAYNAPGVYHRFVNTTDVIATIAQILHLGSLSQFDYFGRPIADAFSSRADLTRYTTRRPAINLLDVNPPSGRAAEGSRLLDLSAEDRADEDLFNELLWHAIKGSRVPYPRARRASLLELRRSQ